MKPDLDAIEATLANGNLNEVVEMAEECIPALVAEVRRLQRRIQISEEHAERHRVYLAQTSPEAKPDLAAEVRKWKEAAEASRTLLEYGAECANGMATKLASHMLLVRYDQAWAALKAKP